MIILQWNAAGLCSHGQELKALIRRKDINPGVICIQETKFKSKHKFVIPGYSCIRKDRQMEGTGAAHGGLAIYIREDLNFKELSVNTPNLECNGIELEGDQNNKINIINIYHSTKLKPMSQNDLNLLHDCFSKKSIFLGDYNSHHPLWGINDKKDPPGSLVEKWIEDKELVIQNDNQPTRYDLHHNTFSAIDLTISTKDIAHRLDWEVLDDPWGSDHFPIFIKINSFIKEKTQSTSSNNSNFNFSKADWEAYRGHIERVNLIDIESPNPETFTDNFTKSILDAASRSIPISKHTRDDQVPWWSSDIDNAREKRKSAFNKAKRHPELLPKAREIKNQTKQLIKESRHNNWMDFCEKLHKPSAKQMWNKIKRIRGGKRTCIIPKLKGESTTKTKANTLAEHYAKVSSNGNHTKEFKDRIKSEPIIPKQLNDDNFTLNKPFVLDELEFALKDRKGTAPGLDLTSYQLLQNLTREAKVTLLKLFNQIWQQGTIPTSWKEALIIPIPKPGKPKDEPQSYRPISLTSNLGKTLEAMVKNRLTHYLETNNLLREDQSGFRAGRSTLDHLARLENDIKLGQALGHKTIAVFLDFSKAFDLVWHNGLIKKLNKLGLKGQIINYIIDFLKDRTIKVKTNEDISDPFELENGTPQGSILSPTLFNIMINDIFDGVSNKVSTSKFADDGALWIRSPRSDTCQRYLQGALNQVSTWADKWGFQLNSEKTTGMFFSRPRQNPEKPRLTINRKQIKYDKEVRFLGLIFDEHLTWESHIKDIKTRCAKDLNLMRHLAGTDWGANKRSLNIVYQSLIKSKIEYGAAIYNPTAKTYKDLLNSIQCESLRMVHRLPRGTSLESILALSGELPLELRREQLLLNFWAGSSHLPIMEKVFRTDLTKHTEALIRNKPSFEPICSRINKLLQSSEIKEIRLQEKKTKIFTPSLPKPKIDLNLTKLNKLDKSNHARITKNYIANNYNGWSQMYTDGSHDPISHKTGFGVHVQGQNNYTFSGRLPNYKSVSSAELTAILMAVTRAKTESNNKILICSDSLSSLQALANKNTKYQPDLLANILFHYSTLQEQGKQIKLLWVPSHVGIQGNETADKAAKISLKLQQPTHLLFHSKHEAKAMIKKIIKDKNSHLFKSSPGPTWSKTYFKTPQKFRIYSNNKSIDRTYSRMLVGKTRDWTLNPKCDNCPAKKSISHLVLFCPQYKQARRKLFSSLVARRLSPLKLSNLLDPTKLSTEMEEFIMKTEIHKII